MNNVVNYERPTIEIIEMEPEDSVLLTASVNRNGRGNGLGNGSGGTY